MKTTNKLSLFLGLVLMFAACSKGGNNNGGDNNNPPPPPPPPPGVNEMDFWLTRGNQSVLLQKQSAILSFTTTANANSTILVDPVQTYQSIDGFGYTLTSGSATLINGLSASVKADLLQELFGSSATSIGVNYLRIGLGASDLSAAVYTYDDMPAGQTDPTLANFSLATEQAGGTGLIPLLKEIVAINPAIKILASPWTPPVWMKDNVGSVGGSLKPEYYNNYAQYFVKYIQGMKAEGITIDAITPQNEPLHGGNNPSMVMTAEQQRDFVKGSLGPAFQNAALTTKIIVWDHNLDNPGYPITILSDPAAYAYVDGSAFHLYNGDVSAMTTVHDAFPQKNLYFTEQYTSSTADFNGDLMWHTRNVIIGTMRNWSRNALEWNLANDPNFGPHTDGGCTVCKGALTIGSTVTRNVSYYIIAHAAKFVPAGSTRIYSNNSGSLVTVAFKTPAGKYVVIVLNDATFSTTFNIKIGDKFTTPTMPANSVATFQW